MFSGNLLVLIMFDDHFLIVYSMHIDTLLEILY